MSPPFLGFYLSAERDNALRKNDIGREERSAGEVAILIESSELALLNKEKIEKTMCPLEGRTLQQEGTARVKLLWWERSLAH